MALCYTISQDPAVRVHRNPPRVEVRQSDGYCFELLAFELFWPVVFELEEEVFRRIAGLQADDVWAVGVIVTVDIHIRRNQT